MFNVDSCIQAERKKRKAQLQEANRKKNIQRVERKMAAVARERDWAERLAELQRLEEEKKKSMAWICLGPYLQLVILIMTSSNNCCYFIFNLFRTLPAVLSIFFFLEHGSLKLLRTLSILNSLPCLERVMLNAYPFFEATKMKEIKETVCR